MSSVIHFEIPVGDMPRAQAFYEQSFGFDVNAMPTLQYALITTTPVGDDGRPKEPGAINGGMFRRTGELTGPIVTIAVPSIDASLASIEANGGSTLIGREPVGEMGFSAYFKDCEGNVMGLWENAG